MPRQLPPLNALRAFDAAGRHQSFSGAAEELGVSHSSVSRHVRGLEDRLNVRLFHDLPRGVELTPAGQRYLAYVSPALDQIAEATEALTERAEGVVVVNSEPFFATKWIMPRLAEFQEAYPEIEVRLDATEELINVSRYEADLAIRFLIAGEPEVPCDLISDQPLYTYAAPELAAKISRPRDILNHPRLQDRKGQVWGAWFAETGEVSPDDVPEVGWRMRAMLALDAATFGQGVLLAGADVVAGYLADGRLVQLFDVPLHQGAYFLIRSDTALRRRAVREFRTWLINVSTELRLGENQPIG